MRQVMLVVAVACMFAGTALGQSVISYTLNLGGDNHVADWEAGGNPEYEAGLPYDGVGEAYTCLLGDTITWDAVVAVSGTHSGDAGTGMPGGYVPNGAANLVFSLSVHKDAPENPAETTPVFLSTMNDGDGDNGYPSGNDPLEMAAFCKKYDVDGIGPPSSGAGYGRLFDDNSDAGPGLDRAQYPSTSGHGGGRRSPLDTPPYTAVGGATSVPVGQLAGMGAGYSEFKNPNNGGTSTAGVGIGSGANSCVFQLLHIPNFEGQIATAGMVEGTYYLKLTPGTGNNILNGNFDCEYDPAPRFAWAANQVDGDTIKLEVLPAEEPCVVNISLWSSLRDHGGTCGVLPISVAPGPSAEIVETRHGNVAGGIGGVQRIAVDFDVDITACWDGDVDGAAIAITMNHTPPPATCLAVDAGTVAVTNGGYSLEFDVTGPPSANCTVDISGAVAGIQNDAACTFRLCDGNINYDTKTDLTDASLSKNIQGTLDPMLNPDKDVNCDCKIDLTDFSLLKNQLNGQVTCP